MCNWLNFVIITKLRQKGDAQRKQKKSRATLHDSKNCGIVKKYSIERTLLIEQN